MKKYKKIQLVSVLALFLLVFNACTENYEELNTRNSLVTEELVNVNYMMTYVQAYAIHINANDGTGTLGNFSGMNTREDNRPFEVGDSPGAWNNLYGTYGRNLADIIRICEKQDAAKGTTDLVNKIAVARIMKAWAVADVTDVYGDIPYSESFHLELDKVVFQPKYDSQESIYKDLFKELKEAAAQLDATKATYGTNDLIYGGNVDKWKKLANSLRLRLALRIRYADATLAQENMSDLTEANLITTLADEAFINTAFTTTEPTSNRNTIYTRMINDKRPHTSHQIGKTIVDIMIGSGDAHNPDDPRIALYCDTAYAKWPGTAGYETIKHFGYRGKPLLGLVPVEEKYPWGSNTVSKLSAFWYAPIIERPLMRSSEVYFALAEAALIGMKTGDAEALYKKGIDQAMAWAQKFYTSGKSQLPALLQTFYADVFPTWNSSWEAAYFADKEITAAEIAAFKTKPSYSLTGTTEQKLEKIMNQKILALFPMENQGWFEWRRTGYPRVLVGHDSDALKGVSPRRMPWPQIEQSVNSANYEAALKAIGGTDGRLQKVWWDKNPDAPHAHQGVVPTQPQPWVK